MTFAVRCRTVSRALLVSAVLSARFPSSARSNARSGALFAPRDGLTGQPTRPRNSCFALGSMGVVLRAAGIADRQETGDDCDDEQECENGNAAARQATSVAMLADVLPLEVVLRDTVHRRREIRDRGAETTVAQIQVRLVVRQAQIEMPRLLRRRRCATVRHRIAHETTRDGVPVPLAAGQHGQDPIRRLRPQPVAISLSTHGDAADSGDANKTNHSDSSSAATIEPHRCGFVDKPVSSRNTRNARTRYHGFANRCSPDCKAGANRPSAAWLYEMNAS